MTNDTLVSFLADTLAMWGVAGRVEAGDAPVVALIRAQNGTVVWIERGRAELPFRWFARWRAAGEAAGSAREAHPRACASLVGLLNALRSALGVDRGSPVRIAATPGA